MAIFGYMNAIAGSVEFNVRVMDGLEYLKGLTDDSFSGLEEGELQRVVLDGDNLFALNQVYRTKPVTEAKFEGHRRYIDLQYIHEGSEIIRSSSLTDCRPKSKYDEENDVGFFASDLFTPIALRAGMLCILYPEDIHAPGLVSNNHTTIKKSVVKVLI